MVIYTSNATESVNVSPCKIIKNRCAFPSDKALLRLAQPNISKSWTMPIRAWKVAQNRLTTS
jgi:putative transposase